MNLQKFEESLNADEPPPNLSVELRALWHARNHDWEIAHQLVQDEKSRESAWVHAYLHREEGDYGNARYWYARAERPAIEKGVSHEQEWREIAQELLSSA